MSWGRTGVAFGALLVACSSRVDVASHGEDVSNDGGGAVGTGGSGAAGATGTGGAGAGGSTSGDGTGATGTGGFGAAGATGTGAFGGGGSTGGDGTGAAGSTGTGGFDGTGAFPNFGGSTDVGGSTSFGGTGAAGSTGFEGTGAAGSTGFGEYTSGGDGGLDCSKTPESAFLYQVDDRYALFAHYVGNGDGHADAGYGVGIQTWDLLLKQGLNGPAVVDATISVSSTMPYMAHPGPTVPVVTGGENGIYHVTNLDMSMSGYWRVTFAIQRLDGEPADALNFNLCVVQH